MYINKFLYNLEIKIVLNEDIINIMIYFVGVDFNLLYFLLFLFNFYDFI